MNKNQQVIYNFPKGTYISVNIEAINTDIDKMATIGLEKTFESLTNIHNYFAEIRW